MTPSKPPIFLAITLAAISAINPLLTIEIANSQQITHSIAQNDDAQKLKKLEALKYFEKGLELSLAKQYAASQVELLKALEIFRAIGDVKYEGKILLGICRNQRGLGKFPEAIDACEKSLAIAQKLSATKDIERTLQALLLSWFDRGVGEYERGNVELALKYFLKAEEVAIKRNGSATLAAILIYIGTIYKERDNYDLALNYLNRSIALREGDNAKDNQVKLAVALAMRGDVYLYSSRYAKAIADYNRSLQIGKATGNEKVEWGALIRLGSTSDSLGQNDRALKFKESALALAQKIKCNYCEALSLNGMGITLYYLARYPESQQYLERSLAIYQAIGDRTQEGVVLISLGRSFYKNQQYDRAKQTYDRALTLTTSPSAKASIFDQIGDIYYQHKQFNLALTQYQKSLELARSIKAKSPEAMALSNQGKVLATLKRLPEAEKSLRQAIAIWESFRTELSDADKISFQERVKVTYEVLQLVLIEQGKAQAALEISERARARALAELLASKVNTLSTTAQSQLRQAPNLSKIQQIAKQKNSTLVQYSIVADVIYIWVVQPNGKIAFKESKLPPNTQIKDLVAATRDSVGANRGRNRSKDNNKPQVKSDLKQLHQLLIAPIASELPKDPNASVTIIPQDDLLIVPFAALEDSQGKYFIEQHTINIAPSIQVLGLTTPNRTRSGTPLVVGNPIMPLFEGKPLDSLLGAEEEARSIGTIINTQPLIGAAADKQEVVKRMQSANLIHLATHGFFVKVEGDLPGAVALTGGYLTSDEVFDMQLQADLVVLSACDTGRGNITGDGVVGLSRSLVVAGVPSVMVSLWEVDDKATKVLMEEFYQQFWVKKLPKAQAIRQAMLKTKQQFEDPNLWGAFMLVGDAK